MRIKEKIKNIIFDLGGVLVNLDEAKTISCFGGEPITAFYDKKLNPEFIKLAHKFEVNDINEHEFRKKVCDIFNIVISSVGFDECWNAMIGTMPTHRIEMLLKLREKYNIFVLSNTNKIHYKCFSKKDFWEPKLFNKIYLSFEIGLRKPDPQIFEHILSENTLLPYETFFIDDNLENVKSAKEKGIIAKHIKTNQEIVKLFNNYFDLDIQTKQ